MFDLMGTADQFGELARDLLPLGAAWSRDDGAIMGYTDAIGDVAYLAHQRACDLLAEAFPDTTQEMLDDWERAFGLPDPCIGGAAQSVPERRAWLISRLTAMNGATPGFFANLAQSLGWSVVIAEPKPFRAGEACAGDPVYDLSYSWFWQVHIRQHAQWFFVAGDSRAGDPLDTRPTGVLECIFERLKPAHTTIQFIYEG